MPAGSTFNGNSWRDTLGNVLTTPTETTVDLLAPGVAPYDPSPDFDRVKNKGALPTELLVHAVDSIASPAVGPPLAARETATPDRQLALPAPPPSRPPGRCRP